MRYYLKDIRNESRGFEILGRLANDARDLFANKIVIDMSNVAFISANLSAPLGVVLAQIMDRLNYINLERLRPDVEEVLRRNRFLESYKFEKSEDYRNTTMHFKRLHLSDDTGQFADYIEDQLQDKWLPNMSRMALRLFRKSLFEVFHNAVVHSDSGIGVYVCGQSFPKKNLVYFTIADGGIGIRGSFRRRFNNDKITSIQALKWALIERRTIRNGLIPGGLGLADLQRFAKQNQGRIQIASRFAFCEFKHGEHQFIELASDFPGTAVTLVINTIDQGEYDHL